MTFYIDLFKSLFNGSGVNHGHGLCLYSDKFSGVRDIPPFRDAIRPRELKKLDGKHAGESFDSLRLILLEKWSCKFENSADSNSGLDSYSTGLFKFLETLAAVLVKQLFYFLRMNYPKLQNLQWSFCRTNQYIPFGIRYL